MTIWNYRMILHDHDPDAECHWIGLHAVYYDGDEVVGWNAEPEQFVTDPGLGPDGIIASLERAIRTLRNPKFSALLKRSELEPSPFLVQDNNRL